jgi:hypothetical protein
MGFHKRYIDDEQIIDIYRKNGCQAVIDWFTKGVDALIISGDVAERVETALNILDVDEVKGFNVISKIISDASIQKGFEN